MQKIRIPEFALPLPSPPRESSGTKPVRSLLMVGAMLEDDGGLEIYDQLYLKTVFDLCAKKSIPVSKDVEVGVMNLAYGQDFIVTPPAVDMVVFSYIFYAPGIDASRLNPRGLQSPFMERTPDSNTPWHDALMKSGANWVFNIISSRGANELPNTKLALPPYEIEGEYPMPFNETGQRCVLFTRDPATP